jgi:hypothetical protein
MIVPVSGFIAPMGPVDAAATRQKSWYCLL